jgi:ankyrin repeat protein
MGGIRCGDKVVALSEFRLEDVEELVRLRAERPRLEEAFFTACVNGKVDVVAFLLDQGVSVHLCDNRESTGLHWASTNGHVGVCQFLLDRGADLDTVNEDGTSALHEGAVRFFSRGSTLWMAGSRCHVS